MLIQFVLPVLGSCPTGWEKFDKNCYLFQDTDLQPWTTARYKCQKQGGNLVSITSQQEQDFITFHYQRKAAGNIWIGVYSLIEKLFFYGVGGGALWDLKDSFCNL